MRYNEDTLVVRAKNGNNGQINSVNPDTAGWNLLNFEVRRLSKDQIWKGETGENEAAFVLLGGQCSVETDKMSWELIGQRKNVFDGMPTAVYLPRHTEYLITGLTEKVEIAEGWVPTDEDHDAKLIRPQEVPIEIRGGNGATRQINSIIPPGFDCHRLVVVEVYTPGGNWSSYPPHKHDDHLEDEKGNIIEADLEEIYFYKIEKTDGFAIQRVYTDDRAIDSAVVASDNDIVLVPAGYHPVNAAFGYNCYYLNYLAGSAQSLAAKDDPAHAWVKDTWSEKDPRVPMVGMK